MRTHQTTLLQQKVQHEEIRFSVLNLHVLWIGSSTTWREFGGRHSFSFHVPTSQVQHIRTRNLNCHSTNSFPVFVITNLLTEPIKRGGGGGQRGSAFLSFPLRRANSTCLVTPRTTRSIRSCRVDSNTPNWQSQHLQVSGQLLLLFLFLSSSLRLIASQEEATYE